MIHMIVFTPKYQSHHMVSSGIYTVCLTFSLLWETQIVHTEFGNNIKNYNIILQFVQWEEGG